MMTDQEKDAVLAKLAVLGPNDRLVLRIRPDLSLDQTDGLLTQVREAIADVGLTGRVLVIDGDLDAYVITDGSPDGKRDLARFRA